MQPTAHWSPRPLDGLPAPASWGRVSLRVSLADAPALEQPMTPADLFVHVYYATLFATGAVITLGTALG